MDRRINTTRFRMTRQTAEELLGAYAYYLTGYGWENEHERLLYAHMQDLYVRIERLCRVMQKSGTLTLNNSESLAFYQLWNTINTEAWPLANVLLCDMIKKIDQAAKQPKYAR